VPVPCLFQIVGVAALKTKKKTGYHTYLQSHHNRVAIFMITFHFTTRECVFFYYKLYAGKQQYMPLLGVAGIIRRSDTGRKGR